MLRSSPPVAERLQERGLGVRREIVQGQRAGNSDGRAQLLQILGAAVAMLEVTFERASDEIALPKFRPAAGGAR